MTTVYEHLEAFAGEMIHGWNLDSAGNKAPFQVVQTAGGPCSGTTTFATLGLSNFPLPDHKGCASPTLIRHELIMIVPDDAVPSNIAGIIQQAGLEAINRGAAYLRGELIGPRGEIFAGHEPKALYASIPIYFPREFWTVNADNVGDVVFVWLVPLLDDEVNCAITQGWDALEAKLDSEDPDLIDYRRGASAR